jgi:hypothetical protein
LDIKNSKIKRLSGSPANRPSRVKIDGMRDIDKIRKHNRIRGIKSNLTVNKRN